MKKNKGKAFVLMGTFLFALFVTFRIGTLYGSDSSYPGSDEDPLITKSYLDERIGGLSSEGGLERVILKKGKKLFLKRGGLLLVYRGNAKVLGEFGLVNTGKGNVFQKGDSIAKYYFFLAPDQNSGIIASDNMILFVSSGYQIK